MVLFYIGKVLELIGLVSLVVGLYVGMGNHLGFMSPLGPMSAEKAMGIELLFFLGGLATFGVGRWIEKKA
ncbi:MAG: hypothetical protein OXT69_11740 [Candidatus Poribacteria bacterium]|nr:hypothetical protein [Candidatus Poribacteria bacterium]